jgi:hypothetical protein
MDSGVVLLKAAEASVTTCTVTIKAIKINNRQMTQAIFNQMPCEELFDERTLEVAETTTVWGWVNYRPKDALRDHTQFVAQKAERLVRCQVKIRQLDKKSYDGCPDTWPDPLRWDSNRSYTDAGCCLLAQALDGSATCREEKNQYGTTHQRYWVDMGFPFGWRSFLSVDTDGSFTSSIFGAIRAVLHPQPTQRLDYNKDRNPCSQMIDVTADEVAAMGRETLRAALVKRAGEAEGAPTGPMIAKPAYWRDRLDKRSAAATDYIKRWNVIMDQLAAAEQLYIAT